MSAEYERSHNVTQRNDIMEKSLKSDSSNDYDDTLEDLAGSANNSIIGKVKSRVSSIIPTSLSKWFSPSTRNNESLNGSFSVGTARRRRRLEVDDDDYADDTNELNEGGVTAHSEYKENLSDRSDNIKDSEDDTDNNSEEDNTNETRIPSQRAHYTMKTYDSLRQPPSKRSRISYDNTNVHQPLVASTPSIGISHRNIAPYSSSYVEDKLPNPTTSRYPRSYTETSAHNQQIVEDQPSYAFLSPAGKDDKIQENIAAKLSTNDKLGDNLSSRRTLHLPSSSQGANERSLELNSTKRQSLSGVMDVNKHTTETFLMNASTTVAVDERDAQLSQNDQYVVETRRNLNGSSLSAIGSKKEILNGTAEAEESNADSASECSEGFVENIAELPNNLMVRQRKTGLFNMSQNGKNSRTPSFGNGINFYSHLEGRKSLFSGGTRTGDPSNALNNSTLSLTSLNRRQFNASIYGSTSALSDSRLLNTFSPFYKGKTTYGGAAAYKKYTAGGGDSRVCNITPTIIRPTSSLSTLSSSNNSLAGASNALGALGSSGAENTSAISSTAKRILDLINDFATPLSEAKKMANSNIKGNSQTLPQAKSRLNESDLQTSRAIRLSQVRTPYTRPAVTLQPISRNAVFPPPVRELQVPSMSQLLQMKKMQTTTERSRKITMQNSSSTTRSIFGGEYKTTSATENILDHNEYVPPRQEQQQHTNKIKSKVRASARITASKNATNLEIGELHPTINLPNIVFPQMQSVPTFDIAVSKTQNIASEASVKNDLSKLHNFTKSTEAANMNSATINSKVNSNHIFTKETTTKIDMGNNNYDIIKESNNRGNRNSNERDNISFVTESNLNFKFSKPLVITKVSADTPPLNMVMTAVKDYKFSPPAAVCCGFPSTETANVIFSKTQSGDSPSAPQLKSGSVLDALKKPINLPSTTKAMVETDIIVGFGDQFRKSAENKWECETCLIRNESTRDKCIACETPRKTITSNNQIAQKGTSVTPINNVASTFGDQFKMSSDKWECEVCMIHNQVQDDKCIACETRRKGSPAATQSSTNLDHSSSRKSNTFGDMFKTKSNTWECPTCLIVNKTDINECVACQTKNPIGSNRGTSIVSDSTTKGKDTTFKFGFGSVNNTISTQSTTAALPDTSFKSLAAAQLSAKWECDACMTRNDAARNKCVCCEQAKPGATTPDVSSSGPKFTFGSTASTKFTFGFGANTSETSIAESNNAATSEAKFNQKTDGATTKGFIFGNKPSVPSSGGVGFTFGIQQASSKTEIENDNKNCESKDTLDKGISSTAVVSEEKTGLKLVSDIVSTNKDTATSFTFGIPSSTGTSPTAKPSLAAPGATADPLKTGATETPVIKTSSGGFTFGNSSIANVNSQPSTSGFTFGVPAKTPGGETSSVTTGSDKTVASLTFGSTVSTQAIQTTTISSTATVKPMFSFGSSTTPTKATTASTSAITSTTTSSSNTTAFSNPTGGFRFGNSTSGTAATSSTAKSLFGSFATPTTTISVATSVVTPVPATTVPKLSAAPTNVFGTFGEITSSPKTTTTTSAASIPTVPAPTILPATATANIFGVMPSASGDSKPTASATMIFGNANNATTGKKATDVVQSTQFAFGTSKSNANTTQTNTATGSGVIVAPSWPKGGFAFGGPTVNSGTSNTNESSKPVFGSFMTAVAPVAAPSVTTPVMGTGNSVFGSISVNNTTSGATATFGSVSANASTASPAAIFGSSASTAPTQTTPNLFGSVPSTTSTFGASPSFGSGNSNMGNNATAFGVASPTTFGGFGSTTSARQSGGDGASAPKKSEPAFNFGGNTSQAGSSGGFNFGTQGSSAAKPAFNFSASNAPTFNFTGSSSDAAKPFQFGVTPSAPVFNFSGGAVEATPNAPFQFNAGSAPASSNIFAPTPATPNAPGGGPMQARRKIRQPTRRLTPR